MADNDDIVKVLKDILNELSCMNSTLEKILEAVQK